MNSNQIRTHEQTRNEAEKRQMFEMQHDFEAIQRNIQYGF